MVLVISSAALCSRTQQPVCRTQIFARASLVVLTVLELACGYHPTAPSVAQVAGIWTGTATLTTVNGGECLNDLYSQFIGQQGDFSVTITQNGTALSSTSLPECPLAG